MKQFLRSCFYGLALICTLTSSAMAESKPEQYKEFKRLSWEQMQDIASPSKLSHRIFYEPSKGKDAKWFDAVKRGDTETVKQMIQAGQDIEAKDEASLQQTALGWAAFIGYLDIVELLKEKGANLFATDKADVQHSFKSAVLGGNMDVINYLYPLMKDKINLNAQDERDGETALMVAAWNNRIETVKFLIEKGADINIVALVKGVPAYNHSALTYACKEGNTEIVNILISAGAVNHLTNKPACN